MDERLEAGRHHLGNGDRALREGYLDDSRSHFEAALLQFRGPELRLGEAHALRGLAHVELGCGKIALAEQMVRTAIRGYQAIRDQLSAIDALDLSGECLRDAEEGEGAGLVLLGDLLMRLGREGEAREILHSAREIYAGLGELPSAAGMWMALGRLGLRTGRLEEARQSLERGLQIHDKSGDTGGQCVAKLALAEVLRAEEALDEAQALLDEALAKAQLIRSGQLEGRAQSRRAALLLQRGRVEEAGKAWSLALDCLRASGDTEMEGYALVGLGEVRSSLGRSDAMSNLAEGARVLGALEHQHGLGVAMTHVAQHGLRLDKPGLAAAAAESARQLLQRSDPVRGGGRALRLLVKALAALEEWPAVNVVAQLRAQVAGTVQPNAIAVRDFYLARSPQDSREDLEGMSDDQLEVRAETLLEPILNPILLPLDLDPFALGTPGGALALVAALVEVAPAAGASIAEPETVTFESDEPLQAPTHGEFTSLYSLPGPEMPIPADADGVESRD